MTLTPSNHDPPHHDDLPAPYRLAVQTIIDEPMPEVDLARLNPHVPATPAKQPPRRRWLLRIGTWAAAAAAVLFLAISMLQPPDAWAQVAEAIRKQPWVRLSISSPVGAQRIEMWFSPTKKLAAAKHPKGAHFLDLNLGEAQRYDVEETTIYKSSSTNVDHDQIEVLITLFDSFAYGGDRAKAETGSIKLLQRSRREGLEGGKRCTMHVLDFEDFRRTPSRYRQTFYVPEGQELPDKMAEELEIDGEKMVRTFVIDYPATGPESLLALDVPQDAKVVDTRSSESLKVLLAEFEKQQQMRLEPYSAVVLATYPWSGWKDIFEAYRLRGDGASAVVDQADPEQVLELRQSVWEKRVQIPADADKLQWWQAEVAKLPFSRSEITQAVFIPGQSGYQQIGVPSESRVATLEPKPAFGPAGCPRLTVTSAKTGEKEHVYWFDPNRGHMIVRWEQHAHRDPSGWIYTMVVDQAERSPGGRWYATHVRHGHVEHSGDELPAERGAGPVGTMVFRVFVEFDKP